MRLNPSLDRPFDQEILERGAQALFEFVFSGTERLDGKHLWANCDEKVKAGFRAEAKAVVDAVFAGLTASLSSAPVEAPLAAVHDVALNCSSGTAWVVLHL